MAKERNLKEELFAKVILFSSLVIATFGLLLAYFSYLYETQRTSTLLEQRNAALKHFLEARFLKIRNIVEFLSSVYEVRNAPRLDAEGRAKALELYRRFQEIDPEIHYVYSGYTDTSLLINDYTPPEGYDPRVRPWYQAALKAYPRISGGIPYTEIKSGEWLVSISKVLLDDEGNITGVVSGETPLEPIVEALRERTGNYRSMWSFVTRSDGVILIHPQESLRGRTLKEITGSPIAFEKDTGRFTYSSDGGVKIAYYAKIAPLDWIVITVVERKEMIALIARQILKALAITSAVALVLGWILSGILSYQVITPIMKLKERAEDIVRGIPRRDAEAAYPRNEIGAILSSIEELTGTELYRKNQELQKANEQLEQLSITDQLTGLHNRRKVYAELKKELERAHRYGRTFSAIMFDLDNLKTVNDTLGHRTGDAVLVEVARITRSTVRSTDIVSRWGGDEFLIVCPETELAEALKLAERLRETVAHHPFPGGIPVTISAGVGELSLGEDIEHFLSRIDEALYRAKNSGKNTVTG